MSWSLYQSYDDKLILLKEQANLSVNKDIRNIFGPVKLLSWVINDENLYLLWKRVINLLPKILPDLNLQKFAYLDNAIILDEYYNDITHQYKTESKTGNMIYKSTDDWVLVACRDIHHVYIYHGTDKESALIDAVGYTDYDPDVVVYVGPGLVIWKQLWNHDWVTDFPKEFDFKPQENKFSFEVDYSSLRKPKLRIMVQEKGLRVPSRISKDALVEMLQEKELEEAGLITQNNS